jgi:hypothetical protein
MSLIGKHMDVVPPLGWNWNEDDWRIFNFCRDLDFRGGVVSGGLFDQYVLIRYDRKKPSKSLIIIERVLADWTMQKHDYQPDYNAKHPNCRSIVSYTAHFTIEDGKVIQRAPIDQTAWKKGA